MCPDSCDGCLNCVPLRRLVLIPMQCGFEGCREDPTLSLSSRFDAKFGILCCTKCEREHGARARRALRSQFYRRLDVNSLRNWDEGLLIKRSSGEIETGWRIAQLPMPYVAPLNLSGVQDSPEQITVTVVKRMGQEKGIYKGVLLRDLMALNPAWRPSLDLADEPHMSPEHKKKWIDAFDSDWASITDSQYLS